MTLLGAQAALANAPNPVAGTTKVDSLVVHPDGSRTITVQGQWIWVDSNEPNCPAHKDGVGYQVDWFDNTANPIGQPNSPDGTLYVGDGTDDMVHSLEALGGSSSTGNAFWDGVPSNYLAHNADISTPNRTDASDWVSNCGTTPSGGGTSSGTWGPISHTYAASFTGPISFCPVMYDPHGRAQDQGGFGSNPGDLTAGGRGHNGDNSYEGNGVDNACQQYTVPSSPGISVLKLQREGDSGPFTSSTILATVGEPIDYEIQVKNTGNTALTLSLSDPLCDSETVSGPVQIVPTLSGDVLLPGGEAQYTCSHLLRAGDASPFVNTATVTGQPPSGPAVSGTSSVNANKQVVHPIKLRMCPAGTIKKTRRRHGKKVTACVAKKRHHISHRPRRKIGFTG